jgi:glycosyltransferase involved in cell wall biosynthesis
LQIAWTKIMEGAGNAFGYSNHQKQLRLALERQGVEFDHSADIQVTIVPACSFDPIPNKINVLYTMYESVDIPQDWIEKLDLADLIVVPCEHNRRIFQRYTKKPVVVCLEGTKPDVFTYRERHFPAMPPFKYLWFGASNPRKGYEHMIIAWQIFNNTYPEIAQNCELYMKTTQLDVRERIIGYKDGEPIMAVMPSERIFQAENAIVDTRRLPEDELVKIYHDAHCFVFPTMGEGFGLTLAEAMSTGLPCIYTPWSGPVDFISGREGYKLKFRFKEVKSKFPDKPEHITMAASPDVNDIVRQMVRVYHDYDIALDRGKKAAERIRKEITWDISAKRFIDILNSFISKKEAA